MRLLNTTSLELKDFIGSNIPPYVILSHTWSDEEVLFDDIQKGTATLKKGHAKLKGCCQKAAEDGFDWVWIDTCCIDKSSSAELSEAINSMYEWYKKSTICYAYLQDVSTNALSSSNPSFTRYDNLQRSFDWARPFEWVQMQENRVKRDAAGWSQVSTPKIFRPQDFSKSRWFTRGWTLQELVASKVVEFYTAEWVEIGTKRSLLTQLSAITGIPPHILRGGSPSTCNIAERMSWASKRQTSREEDLAYCLLGLFNVNMPMLYGEGKKAFYRLQEQIMNQEEDYSIFAWSLQYDCGPSLTGLLASSPVEFSKTAPSGLQLPTLQHLLFPEVPGEASDAFNSQLLAPQIWGYSPWGSDKLTQINMRDFYATGSWYRVLHDKEYESLNTHIPHQHLSASGTTPSQDQAPWKPPQLTSRGLRVSLPIRKPNDPTLPSVAWIYCKFGLEARLLCILLQHLSPSSQLLGRHSASWLISVDASIIKEFVLTELYLHPNGTFEESPSNPHPGSYSFKPWGRVKVKLPNTTSNYLIYVVSAYPYTSWSLNEFFFHGDPPVIGVLLFECVHEQQCIRFTVAIGAYEGHPWCEVRKESDQNENTLEALFQEISIHPETFGYRSDRAAVLASPDLFCSAAMRKSLAIEDHITVYELRVTSCAAERPDIWIGLHMSESGGA